MCRYRKKKFFGDKRTCKVKGQIINWNKPFKVVMAWDIFELHCGTWDLVP